MCSYVLDKEDTVNLRLRIAMIAAQVDAAAVARATGVDPKTVQRWLGGRLPHPRHRWGVADLLGEKESYLWPAAGGDLAPGAEATAEVVAAYGHRADIPISKWSTLLATARQRIDLLGYAHLFLAEQHIDLVRTIEKACALGCKVRILFANPKGTRILERDSLERLGGTLPARILMTLAQLEDLRGLAGVEIRFHDVHLYQAIYRFDDEMIVTPHLLGAHGFQHPAFHLRQLGSHGVFASFVQQLDTVWAQASPMEHAGAPIAEAREQRRDG
jgi:hypothetical protein